MDSRIYFFISVLLFVVMLQNAAVEGKSLVKRSASPNRNNEVFHGGYLDTAQQGNGRTGHITAAAAGQNRRTANQQNEQQIIYVHVGNDQSNGRAGKVEVGLHRASGTVENLFGFGARRDGNYETKFLSAGVDAGLGVMARAALVDATVNTGHFGVNVGVGLDTGIIVTDGIEAKYLGIGGKITRHGVQICFVICFGINY